MPQTAPQEPVRTVRRPAFARGQWRAAALVTAVLALFSPWTFPNAPDGLLVLRTAEAMAFEGTFVLPPAGPGAHLHPWFFRPAPGGAPGVVSVYQPLGSVWRAAILAATSVLPEGRARGVAADFLLSLVPILLTAASVFPLSRLLRYGGLGAVASPRAAAILLLGSFLGPLGTTDFNESLLDLAVLVAVERSLRTRRMRSSRGSGLATAGFLGAAANLVKPVAAAAIPALAVSAVLPRSRSPRLRLLAALLGGTAAGLVLFLGSNLLRTGQALELGYADQPIGDVVSPLWTLLRLTLLPNRGLLWLAPVWVVGLAGLVRLLRSRVRRAEGFAALLGFGGFFAVNLAYWAWDGGMGWAPRYLAPALVLLAPAIGAGARAWPRTFVTLGLAGFLLNLSGYLVDPDRVYRVAAAAPASPEAIGPFVPLHGDGRGALHPLQRPHYVPSFAGVVVAPRILFHLLTEGDGPTAGAAPSGQRRDSLLVRRLLGDPLLGPESRIGRLLYEESAQTAQTDPERALRFASRAIAWGGPAVDSRAVGSYLALVTGRPKEAARLAEEGLSLDPAREDLRVNLAVARERLTGTRPSRP